MDSRPGRPSWLGLAIRNGPAIVTVLGSAAVALLSAVFKFSTEQFLQTILALLAFMGTSLVVDRSLGQHDIKKRLKSIEDQVLGLAVQAGTLSQVGIEQYVFSRRDLEPLESRLAGAREVFISGGSLFRLINEYKRLFENLAEQGCRLRFLMVEPDGPAAEQLATLVSYEANSISAYRANMEDAVSGFESLAKRYPHVCELALSSIVPPFSLMLIRKGQESAILQVELYPCGVPARDRPLLRLDEKRDQRLFALFAGQVEILWSLPGNTRLGKEPAAP